MNAIQILASHAWVERLAWTLIHFLWQSLLIAVLYDVVRRGMSRASSPNSRYRLACAALAVMMAAPLVTWELLGPSAPSPYTAYRIHNSPPSASAASGAPDYTLPAAVLTTIYREQPAPIFAAVVMLWMAGAMVFWVRLAGGWIVAARLRSTLVRPAPPEWQQTLASLAGRIGLSRPVSLLVSALVQVPTVVGWLRPVVLVPVGALSGLPAEHVEALLLHELAHIRRLDYLVNLLQGVAEAFLFYHPAVWWVSGHIRAERELCCDDAAVALSGDAFTYCAALAKLESYRTADFHAALAANGGSLAHRIARLLGHSRPATRRSAGPGVFAAAILLAATAYGLFAQSGSHPAFEVASIKRTPPELSKALNPSMGGGVQPGGRMHIQDLSLVLLIQFAYAPHDVPHPLPLLASQVVGPPGWMQTEGYDIEAKPPDKSAPVDSWLMLQTLLADRFKLSLHRESRELPVYNLTVAKGGLHLPAAKEAGCVSFGPGNPPHQVPGKVDCGYVSGPYTGGAPGLLHIQGRKDHIADLIRELAFILDRPVIDKTGYTGEFDLNLNFAPDATLRGFQGVEPAGPGVATDPNQPNIVDALEQQLGLKLVQAKGPVEVLVIDHAERPTAN